VTIAKDCSFSNGMTTRSRKPATACGNDAAMENVVVKVFSNDSPGGKGIRLMNLEATRTIFSGIATVLYLAQSSLARLFKSCHDV